MSSKRKPDELGTPRREGQRLDQLQAQLPRFGLLWGVEGSVERLLDRERDVQALQSALDERRHHIGVYEGEAASLEAMIAEVLDACSVSVPLAQPIVNVVEFLDMVWQSFAPWSDRYSAHLIMEVCLKVLAARRAYKNSGRRFHTLNKNEGLLFPAMDRLDAALEPGQLTTWIEAFITPVAAEQADDESDIQPVVEIRKTPARQQKRRTTVQDNDAKPHTPPRLLSLSTSSGALGAPKGFRYGLAFAGRSRSYNHDDNMASPSRPSSTDEDLDVIMGGMANFNIQGPSPRPRPRRKDRSATQTWPL